MCALAWNSAFNLTPAGTDDRRSVDDRIREMKSELYKRLTLLFNFEADPDGGGYAFDLIDDVVLAEHISGLTGTGAVDADNIPEGSTNLYFNGKTLDDIGEGTTYKRVAAAHVGDDGVLNPVETVKDQGGIATDGLKCKIIEIGDWNMTGTQSVAKAHGLDVTKIRKVEASKRDDSGTLLGFGFGYCFSGTTFRVTGIITTDATNVNLDRGAGTYIYFTGSTFDATTYNRGWIMIWYEA